MNATTTPTSNRERETTHCDPIAPFDMARAVLTDRDGAGQREMIEFVGWNHDSTRVYGLWSSASDVVWAEENPLNALVAYDRKTGVIVYDEVVIRELIAMLAQETERRVYSGRHS